MDSPIAALRQLADHGRQQLALVSLTPPERRRLLGKWYATSHDFACRAADSLARHQDVLAPLLPYGPADIQAQRQRVLVLERAEHELAALAQQARDTLLLERARLYQMSSGVLTALQWLRDRPFAAGPALELSGSVANLRRERDRRNERIRRSKQQARQGSAVRSAPRP
ncbi:MAG: hypothetical protein RMK29_14345, partial [Myxococcales bacterium]|nr:hypothetical protein [Myxococcales bacterium]